MVNGNRIMRTVQRASFLKKSGEMAVRDTFSFCPGSNLSYFFYYNHQSVAVQLVNCRESLTHSGASLLCTTCSLPVNILQFGSGQCQLLTTFFSINSRRAVLHVPQLREHQLGQEDCYLLPKRLGQCLFINSVAAFLYNVGYLGSLGKEFWSNKIIATQYPLSVVLTELLFLNSVKC